mgnify:CR=1 FL=1
MYISATLFCMRPSAGNGRYPQTAKCSRSVPEKIVSRCAAVLLSLRKPACGYRNRILSELQKASFFVAEGRSLFVYRGAVQKSMYRFKYAKPEEICPFSGGGSHAALGKLVREKRIEAIVPVPMYLKKERYRGYNQAALFGRALSEKMDIPCIPRLMIRVKDTRPQKELNGRERENNVKNAFQSPDNVVKYKRILIVDDIYTTGSTVEAVAERLKEAGAEQVYVLTACIGRGF